MAGLGWGRALDLVQRRIAQRNALQATF